MLTFQVLFVFVKRISSHLARKIIVFRVDTCGVKHVWLRLLIGRIGRGILINAQERSGIVPYDKSQNTAAHEHLTVYNDTIQTRPDTVQKSLRFTWAKTSDKGQHVLDIRVGQCRLQVQADIVYEHHNRPLKGRAKTISRQ